MTDAFREIVDELGEEILGVKWLLLRSKVHRWIDGNPQRVEWLIRRLRGLFRGGAL